MAQKARPQAAQRIDNEMVRADVRDVPIVVMREENRLWLLFGEDPGDALNGFVPGSRVVRPGLRIDAFEPVLNRGQQPEANVVAAGLQFLPPLRLSRLFAPLR